MALVNPNIAMSYRPTVEYQPRNALAEAAQIQQIMGGQRQAEMANMQMEALRRKDRAISQIQAAAAKNGGPTDRREIARAYVQSGVPEFMQFGLTLEKDLDELDAFARIMGGGGARPATGAAAAAGSNAMAAPATAAAPAGELVAAPMPSLTGTVRDIAPAGAPGAASRAVFNQDAITGIDSEAQKSISLILDDAAQLRAKADEFRGSVRASGFLNQAEQLENQAASMLAVQKRRAGESRFDTGAPATAEQVNAARQALAVGQAPVTNTLAPAAAPVTNAMLAPAAQPAVPPASVQLASAGAGPNIDDLMARYDLAAKAGHPMAPAILKQIEAALRADPSETRTMQQLGYPLTQEGYASFRAAQMREQAPAALVPILQNGRPVLVPREQAVGQTPFSPASVQVLGMGQGREAPAPTITQIQDPTNPAQMITIDARRYQGGGVGSPGVIGTSGKPAPVAAAAVKQEQGLSKADDILSTLQSAYAQLKERRAIPSEQNNVISNIWASIAASGPGQVAGRTVGTAAQTQRDIIQSSRNQLLLAIKDATGLSAQQLNSNMELQTWLNSLTDPTRSIEANEAILQNVRRFIDSAGRYTAKQGAAPAAPAAPATGAGGALTPAEQAELQQLRSRFGGGRQ